MRPWPRQPGAGIVVGKLGTAIREPGGTGRAVHTEVPSAAWSASRPIALATSRPPAPCEKVVFTNGCFDILHAGQRLPSGQCGKLLGTA